MLELNCICGKGTFSSQKYLTQLDYDEGMGGKEEATMTLGKEIARL